MSEIFTVGTDTEYFLQSEEGALVSAIRFIKGGKHDPVTLKSGGNVTYDNVALEYATPVADSRETFVKAIRETMKEALSHLPKGVSIQPLASTEFPIEELRDPRACEFGCEPDYDAWQLVPNQTPEGAEYRSFRCVGGHLHVGYVEGSGNEFLLDPMGKVNMTKAFDIFLGIPFTFLDQSPGAVQRRSLYGKAGCHRPTVYGVEYRTLSNYWTYSPKLVKLVYALAECSIQAVKDGTYERVAEEITPEEIQRVINDGDTQKALDLWESVISKHTKKSVQTLLAKVKDKQYDPLEQWGV